MNERHRAQRVVDAIAAIRQGVFDRQDKARRQLAEWTAGIHQRRRVWLEPPFHHEAVEIGSGLRYVGIPRAISAVGLCNRASYPPEHVLWLLQRLARCVLDQISLSDHGTRVVIELGITLGRYGGYGH